MKLSDIKNVSVIGAGNMGHGISLLFALFGYQVYLNDKSNKILNEAIRNINDDLKTFTTSGLASQGTIQKVISRIKTTISLEEAVKYADFVIETASEELQVKTQIFTDMDVICPQHTILASNTSSLSLQDFTKQCKRRDKILLTHWINPPHIMPVVEIMGSEKTSETTIEIVSTLLKKINKIPIRILKEVQGLVINRVQAAMIREVLSLWEQGVATPADIDQAVKGSFGLRLVISGPLETCDFGGLDIWYRLANNLFKVISDTHEPPESIKRMIDMGNLGFKSGKGFFDYDTTSQNKEPIKIIKKRDAKLIRLCKMLYDNDE